MKIMKLENLSIYEIPLTPAAAALFGRLTDEELAELDTAFEDIASYLYEYQGLYYSYFTFCSVITDQQGWWICDVLGLDPEEFYQRKLRFPIDKHGEKCYNDYIK